jgi:16S rRNA (adenine1518-N6/adenine1519-N6)-dimethyltransferase
MTSGYVRPKKHLGQHFLTDRNIAGKIVDAIQPLCTDNVLEIGPGKGILTELLVEIPGIHLKCVEIDHEAADFLSKEFGKRQLQVICDDFLKIRIDDHFDHDVIIIGNFPYNISSQILFSVLENKWKIPVMVGMFQKEVAQRIASPPGSKNYGILSVLVQSYYHVEMLFQVSEHVFSPPPKVQSAVIRLIRKDQALWPGVDYSCLALVVKTAFGKRRKMLKNSLDPLAINTMNELEQFFKKRPEQLTVSEFHNIAELVSRKK